jgi:type IV pilus assembly protein PilQ
MSTKRNFELVAALGILSFLGGGVAWATGTVTSIDYKLTDGKSLIEITGDGTLAYTQQENAQDKQLVIDLSDTKLAKTASRKLDTSSFNGNVSLISPYQVDGSDGNPAARVVIQMRDSAVPQVSQAGNVIQVTIPGKGSASADARAPDAQADPSGIDSPPSTPAEAAATEPATATDPAAPPAPTEVAQQATDSSVVGPKDKLQQFIDHRETKRFTGKPINIELRDADLVDVFRFIGEASGFNIVMGDDVKGKITLSLKDVPWDQALDLILRSQQLGAERNNNILRVVSLANLTKEKRLELEAEAASQASTPRVTRIFPISYAKLSDLQAILTKFAASSVSASLASGANLNDSVLIQADERTNSIVVRDTPENVEKMRKLIEILDTQTPQIMIESKVVEATETNAHELTGALGATVNWKGHNDLTGSFDGGSLSGAVGTFVQGDGNNTFGFAPSFGFLKNGIVRLNSIIKLNEQETKARVISSPKLVVLNKEKASLVSGTPVLIPTPSTNSLTGQSVPSASVQQANLKLDVTPTVTNEGSVLMQLTLERDVVMKLAGGTDDNQVGIGNRSLDTKVLVQSGNTLVIGGIYSLDSTHGEGGFPFLRKIPIVGTLFGNNSNTLQRSELFIFITPRILNEREAGLGG